MRRIEVACRDHDQLGEGLLWDVGEQSLYWIDVWSIEVYSGRLIRFDPMGAVDRIVGLPVQSTTSLTFGGENLDLAYVTSMAQPMNGQYHCEHEAGCLFAVYGLGVRCIPEPRFAG